MRTPKLLLLGGTTEASALASWLQANSEFDSLLSFAGTTRTPRPPPIAYRVGGFGGAAGLAAFLRAGGFTIVIDATHPFAAKMKRNAAEAAAIANIPLLGVLRPGWHEQQGDNWTRVPDMASAAVALGAAPQRILLTIGQKDLAAFRAAPQHHYIVRSVDPPDADSLPPSCEVIAARGPFLLADEAALLRNTGVSLMVTKDSGGTATADKLKAARMLGIRVVMVNRPLPPEGVHTVPDAESAQAWLLAHAGTERGE
jgi:precorrin-6A/cobalt-precorrin-6A reductase